MRKFRKFGEFGVFGELGKTRESKMVGELGVKMVVSRSSRFLLEPKNQIKDILISPAALFHEFILKICTRVIFYSAYDFFR